MRASFGFAASAFVIVAMLSAGALAAQSPAPIAEVTDLVNQAFHQPPEAGELPAQLGDRFVQDETIRTEADSAIELSFPDGATLRLESDSELVLDSYVYDGTNKKTFASLQVGSGIVRYTNDPAGGVDDTGVTLMTSAATVGIRGTDVVVSVGSDGVTIIDVLAGKVFGKPNDYSEGVEAGEGQSILILTSHDKPEVGLIGDFSTAAGTISVTIEREGREFKAGHKNVEVSHSVPGNSGPGDQDPDPKDPPEPVGNDNHSGHGDGSNPGKGGGNGHDKGGGSDNPGGGRK